MGLETEDPGISRDDLNPLWPLEDDPVEEGAQHMRMIKQALKNLNVGGGGFLTGDIRYTALDKDDPTLQPPDYLFASGQAESRTTYSDLFAKIGTRFGEGDGSTTFNMPDVNEGFIPADVGIFTPGNGNGLPTDILVSTLRSNPVTGSLIMKNLSTQWWHYRQKGSPTWQALPFPTGVSSVSWSVADIINDDVIVLVYKETTSSSDRAQRVTWKMGESTEWTLTGEVSTKPNATSSEQNLNFSQMAITPDGSLEVIQATGSANIYLRRPDVDGEFFFRSTTTPNNQTQVQRLAITDDGTKVLRSSSYFISEYTVGTTDPWDGTFVNLPQMGDTSATEGIEYGMGDAIFGAKDATIYFYNRLTTSWVEYVNPLTSQEIRSIAFDSTTGQIVIAVGSSSAPLYRMSAGAAAARIMGYIKT